jgi:hypothetical protein
VDKYNRQGTHVGQIYAGPTAVIALAVKDAQVFVGHEGSICLVDSATGKQSDPEIPVSSLAPVPSPVAHLLLSTGNGSVEIPFVVPRQGAARNHYG